MTSQTKIYVDQNKNGVEIISTAQLNLFIKDCLNKLIEESYKEHNISDYEIIPNRIKLESKIDIFSYRPYYSESEGNISENFTTSFNFFVTKEESLGFPQSNFKRFKEGAILNHQKRAISMHTNCNIEADHCIGNINKNSNFAIISMSSDPISQVLMKKLSEYIYNTPLNKPEVYYQKDSFNNDLEKIQSQNKTRKIRP